MPFKQFNSWFYSRKAVLCVRLMLLALVVGFMYGMFNPVPIHSFLGESDKVDHFIACCLVSSAGYLVCVQSHPPHSPRFYLWHWLYWLVAMVCFALAEVLQGVLLVGRTFDTGDLLANFAGVFSAFCMFSLIGLLIIRRSHTAELATTPELSSEP